MRKIKLRSYTLAEIVIVMLVIAVVVAVTIKITKAKLDNITTYTYYSAYSTLKGVANNNYRYHRMKASDFETSSGFAPLAQHLPIWIRDSLEKIARVNKED